MKKCGFNKVAKHCLLGYCRNLRSDSLVFFRFFATFSAYIFLNLYSLFCILQDTVDPCNVSCKIELFVFYFKMFLFSLLFLFFRK